MNRSLIWTLGALVVVTVAADSVHAQVGRGRSSYRDTLSRPTVSPYMNLLRPDQGPAPNYYTLVRPQVDQREATNLQGGEIRQLGKKVDEQGRGFRGAGRRQMSSTGHRSSFMNTAHFYQVPQQSR